MLLNREQGVVWKRQRKMGSRGYSPFPKKSNTYRCFQYRWDFLTTRAMHWLFMILVIHVTLNLATNVQRKHWVAPRFELRLLWNTGWLDVRFPEDPEETLRKKWYIKHNKVKIVWGIPITCTQRKIKSVLFFNFHGEAKFKTVFRYMHFNTYFHLYFLLKQLHSL